VEREAATLRGLRASGVLPEIMKDQAQIVIIGAGIVGASTAYALAQKGWSDVVVIDQGPLFATGGSTSHAPGLVFQTNGSKTLSQLAQRSVAIYNTLEWEGQPGFYPVGSLEVATTSERLEDLKRRHGWATSWGLPSELLSPQQVQHKLPLIDPAQILGGYSVPSDGIAKAIRVTSAMGAYAQERGISFYGNTEVTGFVRANGRIQAVQTSAGQITCQHVLICAGIWGPKIAKLAGISIPLTPVEHQLVTTTPLEELAGAREEISHPILRHQDRALYYRQNFDSYMVGSYQHEPLLVDAEQIRRHDASPVMPSIMPFTPQHFSQPWQDSCELLPALKRSEPAKGINGMFSFTPDGNPVLGETHIRGLWVAEAVWVTQGGGVGHVMAELLSEGHASLDLRECDLWRFDPHVASPAYVRARGATQYDEVYDILHPLQPLEQPRPLRVSPFYQRQRELGAIFLEARGWERPQWYEANAALLADLGAVPERSGWAARFWSPISYVEQHVTRSNVALYDMTSLPRLEVAGRDALSFLERMTTNTIDKPIGSLSYTLLLDERGGIRSDITVARLDEQRFQLAVNSLQDYAWLLKHVGDNEHVFIRDITAGTCCVGVWGPNARKLLETICEDELSNEAFPYYSARQIFVREVPVLALRVSYVGELGWELYTSADYGLRLWDLLWQAAQPLGGIAAGRGAFDALRLEKGYRLWGNDMQSEHDPFEARLAFAVKLDKSAFIGQQALLERKERGPERKLCCLLLDDPRQVVMGKEPVFGDGELLGYVTSANYGYSVGQSIAYAYLPVAYSKPGSAVSIEYFGQRYPATVAKDPLYDPKGLKLRA
jgi:glycine cleavage system aminomethyltransferase T/glycine/D-amino acid oxidase-like deaminating enzyme